MMQNIHIRDETFLEFYKLYALLLRAGGANDPSNSASDSKAAAKDLLREVSEWKKTRLMTWSRDTLARIEDIKVALVNISFPCTP